MNSDNRVGTAPISISALSKRWSPRRPARRGYLRASLYAVFPALPPVYLQALQALGKHIEIHLLFTNPCRYYWGDIKDPAYLAKLLTRQRRHSFEDRELPLFRDSENAGQLFNSDGEQDVGNPLLASWGKLGRDYIYLLSDLESSQELDAFVDVTPDNLLHNIQSDILELENRAVAGVNIEEFSRSDNKRPLDPLDSSITFHVCHSPQA